MMTSIGDNDNILRNISPSEVNDFLGEYTWEAKWENVSALYYEFPEQAHTAIISDSDGTALHVAIDFGREDVVQELVNAILTHHIVTSDQSQGVEALEMVNDRGDTPLHLAASKGFAKICKCIIGGNKERIYLLNRKNNQGETPLFQAAVNWRKHTFAYLADVSKDTVTLQHLVREDGDSILHTAIRGEYFDLAVIIVNCYDFLITHLNKEGSTPLKVLATRPSAFKSSSNLSWYKRILYHGILVEPLDAERTMRSNLRKMEVCPDLNMMEFPETKFPKNYETLYHSVSIFGAAMFGKKFCKKKLRDIEDPSDNNPARSEKYPVGYLPRNYETFHQFVKSAYVHTLGLSGVELKDVKIAKKKHQWSSQLLKQLLKRPYAAFTGSGGIMDIVDDSDVYDIFAQTKQDGAERLEDDEQKPDVIGETSLTSSKRKKENDEQKPDVIVEISLTSSERKKENDEQKPDVKVEISLTSSEKKKENEKKENEKEIDKKMTALMIAAQNGIVEVVNEILIKIPSVIHDTNSKRENVLLVAVKYRQPLIVETLKEILHSKPELWYNLILAKDKDENTVLHLAAGALGDPWKMSGSALQMMWEIKWFQYVKSLVPPHFYFISNNEGRTSDEIFKESHADLVKHSNEWLKQVCESCSVVAALVAGALFTTVSTVPGGTNDEGRPILERKHAFDVFTISSLIGLSFSVTGLIVFLSVLTTLKRAKDFGRDLPLKLFIGLFSLLVSIALMFVSFSTNFFLLSHNFKSTLLPFYVIICLPLNFYALAQFPLYYDLFKAMLPALSMPSDKGDG